MYKKFFFTACAASMMLFTACQDDLEQGLKDGESVVTFTAELPSSLQSRAFADGKTATNLTYAIYEAGQKHALIVDSTSVQFNDLKATVNVRLVNGKSYDILFWADNANAPYHFDAQTQTINIDYTDITANQENRDAFFAVEKALTVDGTINKNITLTRPFAQLNIGATDTEAAKTAGFETSETKVTVSNVYSSINLFTGAVAGNTELTYAYAAKPSNEQFPVTTVSDKGYLAMNYVLVDGKEMIDVDFTAKNAAGHEITRSYSNVPVQRNYRTSIYGNILTESTQFNVVIEPAFGGEFVRELWDGAKKTAVTEEEGVYSIQFASELAWVAEQVNSGNTFAGKTVKLTDNIYLNNQPWTPMGPNADDNSKVFKGTFDGNGCTIFDLYVNQGAAYHAAGLFGCLNGTVKDLTIDGAKVSNISAGNANGATDNGTAVVAGSIYTAGTIDNVTVKNAEVKGNRYVGGISGYTYGHVTNCTVDGAKLTAECDNLTGSYDNGDKVGGIAGYHAENVETLTGNTVKNTDIKGYRDLGGIVGYATGTTVTGNTVGTLVTITVDNTHNYKNYAIPTDYDANSIIGENHAKTSTGNTGSASIFTPASEYSVSTAAELKAALEAGNKYIILANDIDLTSVEWNLAISTGNFIFDGQGHKITGLKTNNDRYGGLIGKITTYENIVIKNLIIDSPVLTGGDLDGECAGGAVIGWNDNHGQAIEIEDVTVNNPTIEGFKYLGGLVGYENGQGLNIKNCTVNNGTLTSTYNEGGSYKGHIGGMIGYYGKGTVENAVVNGTKVSRAAQSGSNRCGAFAGTIYSGVNIESATVKNVTVDGAAASIDNVFGPNASTASKTNVKIE